MKVLQEFADDFVMRIWFSKSARNLASSAKCEAASLVSVSCKAKNDSRLDSCSAVKRATFPKDIDSAETANIFLGMAFSAGHTRSGMSLPRPFYISHAWEKLSNGDCQ